MMGSDTTLPQPTSEIIKHNDATVQPTQQTFNSASTQLPYSTTYDNISTSSAMSNPDYSSNLSHRLRSNTTPSAPSHLPLPSIAPPMNRDEPPQEAPPYTMGVNPVPNPSYPEQMTFDDRNSSSPPSAQSMSRNTTVVMEFQNPASTAPMPMPMPMSMPIPPHNLNNALPSYEMPMAFAGEQPAGNLEATAVHHVHLQDEEEEDEKERKRRKRSSVTQGGRKSSNDKTEDCCDCCECCLWMLDYNCFLLKWLSTKTRSNNSKDAHTGNTNDGTGKDLNTDSSDNSACYNCDGCDCSALSNFCGSSCAYCCGDCTCDKTLDVCDGVCECCDGCCECCCGEN